MTDNEKFECAIHCMKVQADMEIYGDCKAYTMDDSTCRDIARETIKSLEEVQEYRKLGTVEEIKNIQSKTIHDLINTIQKEIDMSWSSIYECEDGTEITTDVGYVYDWFQEYKEVIKKKYGIKLDGEQ